MAAPLIPLPAALGVSQAVELPAEEVEERVIVDPIGPPLAQDQDMAEVPRPLMVVPPEASSTRAPASGSWAPEGTDNGLRWRRRKKAPPPAGESLGYICMAQLSPVTASDNLRKKALDREVPYHMIPRQDLALYEAAMC